MKKIILNSGFSLLMVFMFSSCLDEFDKSRASYGVIQNVVSKDNYEILTDRGNTLIVTKSETNQEIEEGKRVMANFEILSDKAKAQKEYEVKVNGFYYLLSKPLVRESFILQDEAVRRDSIGNDPFTAIYAWFGGDYFNINFETFFDEFSNKTHLINLVYNDVRVSPDMLYSLPDTLYLTLHHNAYGEVPGHSTYLRKGLARCSFKLSDLLPDGVNEIPVKLMWKEYRYNLEVVDRFDTHVFKKGHYGTSEKSETNGFVDNSFIVN
jgi:hypothetical protein